MRMPVTAARCNPPLRRFASSLTPPPKPRATLLPTRELMSPESGLVHDVLAGGSCSITLPAGCGKTELIARLASTLAEATRPCLVLTHTHAGVDAIRRRLAQRDVPARLAAVRTIDSWCFNLISSYPDLA